MGFLYFIVFFSQNKKTTPNKKGTKLLFSIHPF